MPTQLQFRRGTTTQNNAFTGAVGEISIDTTLDTARVHDGTTAGGFELTQNTATQTLTNKTLTSAVLNTGVSGTAVLDEDDMSSNSATQLATQQSIKAYVDSQITAQDLDFQADSGGALSIDLDSESLTFTGGTGIDTSGSLNTVTFAIDSTVTTLTGTQTLTNKTLTSPTINSATIAMGTNKITGMGDPTSAQDAATKAYVDGELSALSSNSLSEGNTTWVIADSGTGTITATVDGTTHSTFAAAGITLSQGAFVGDVTGNADTATALATARTIAGNSFDGTANITIASTQLSDSSDLARLAAPAFTGTATGVNLTLSGDLTVNGTTTTLATTNTVISDNLIELNNGAASNANDSGIVIERGSTGDNAFIGWDESADKFIVGTTTATGASTGNLTISSGTLVANTFEGALSGNATTATALATGRTISLTGDVTGTSGSFDGSGNVSISATIAANSVALGTDTTGNYVGTITGGTGIASSGATSGEGISHTLSVDLSELTDMTATMTGTDEFIVLDAGADRRKAANEIGLSIFSNDAGFTTNTGDITNVAVSGTGLSGGGASGSVTITSNATNSNTGSTIVARDASGNFSAGTVTATLSGTATNATNFNVAADNSTNATHYIIFTGGASGNQRPNSDTGLTYNPSSNTLSTTNFSGTSTSAKYADLAEKYTSDADYDAGTVLVFGGEEEVTICTNKYDKRIAGIVSTDPAYLMNSEGQGATVALLGRVPCKVIGEIRKGDLMVASDTPGHAQAWRDESNPYIGSVIGKALENKTGAGADVIEVVVGRI